MRLRGIVHGIVQYDNLLLQHSVRYSVSAALYNGVWQVISHAFMTETIHHDIQPTAPPIHQSLQQRHAYIHTPVLPIANQNPLSPPLPPSKLARRIIHHTSLLNQILQARLELQMRLVLVYVELAVLLAREFDHEGVRVACLRYVGSVSKAKQSGK